MAMGGHRVVALDNISFLLMCFWGAILFAIKVSDDDVSTVFPDWPHFINIGLIQRFHKHWFQGSSANLNRLSCGVWKEFHLSFFNC